MEREDIGTDIQAGNVVIEVTAKETKDGSYEWTYKFRRSYEYDGEEKRAWFFGRDNDVDVGNAMVKAFRWMDENDATEFFTRHREQAAA